MSGIQVGSDGKVRAKNDGIVVASEGDPCCCEGPHNCLDCFDQTELGEHSTECCISTNSRLVVYQILEQMTPQVCEPWWAKQTITWEGTLPFVGNTLGCGFSCVWTGTLKRTVTGNNECTSGNGEWNEQYSALLTANDPANPGVMRWFLSSGACPDTYAFQLLDNTNGTSDCCGYDGNDDWVDETPYSTPSGPFIHSTLLRVRRTLTLQNNKCCRCDPSGFGSFEECTPTADGSVGTCDTPVPPFTTEGVNICTAGQGDDCENYMP